MRALIIVCALLFVSTLRADDIESAGLSAWETLGKAGVTYERGFKTYKIDDTNVFLSSCVSVGD